MTILSRLFGRRQSLGGSTLMNSSGQIVNVVLALAITPYIVHRVGLRGFGYWSVLLAIIQYVQIANGSFPTVTTRLVAKAFASENVYELRSVVATTTISLTFVAILVAAIGVGLPFLLPHGSTASLPSGWANAARWSGVSLAVTMIATGLAGVTRGAHRWDLDAGIFSSAQVIGAIATVVLLRDGDGLTGLAIASVLTSVTMLVGYAIVALRYDALQLSSFQPSRAIFRELRQQGAALQVVGLVGTTNAQADRLMLLPFASLSFIGAYALGSRVAVALRSFPLSAFGPLMARAAAAEARGGREEVRAMYDRAFTLVALYALPVLLGAYFAMYPAVLAWLGSRFTISAAAAVILGTGYAANIITGPGTSIAIACGRAELDRDYNVLGLVLNVVLSVILGLLIGGWGVVIATSLGLLLSSLWLVRKADHLLATNIGTIITTRRQVLITYAGIVAIGSVTILGTRALSPVPRLDNLAAAISSGAFALLWLAIRSKGPLVAWLSSRRRSAATSAGRV